VNYTVVFKQLGRQPYHEIWRAMQQFTQERTQHTPDEIWFLEHDPIFTQGQAGKSEHILAPGLIPVIQTDRGGQVTYHGPGQLIMYVMFDLRRLELGIRQLVTLIETAVIRVLASYRIEAHARSDAPGVYIDQAKIASLGLRIRRGCSYHGLSFNIDMDTQPFEYINPCGMPNLPITQLRDFEPDIRLSIVTEQLQAAIIEQLSEHSVHKLHHRTEVNGEYCP
jgi:lipoyl(octanoyl) transferase